MKNILIDDIDIAIGKHNVDEQSVIRLKKAGTYKDCSTIVVTPSKTRYIHMRVANSWFNLQPPMNQKFFRLPVIGLEVGEAYDQTFQQIVAHPDLSTWKYILTLESDNIPPPDGLIKLLENMNNCDVVGGLYWTKGELGQPMIYGDPNIIPLNFWPQVPKQDTLQYCNGLGMGFTLFKIEIFKDSRLTKPWFKTLQEENGGGLKTYTQDLFFFEKAIGLGYKVACDTRVKVGHYSEEEDIVW